MISVTREHLRVLAPNARDVYLSAFATANDLFAKYEINSSAIRLAHFLAQILHESGGLRVLREDMHYREATILKIFGENHSARVKPAEAKKLAGKPYELAERVYGIGNPKKAKEFGHTKPGDGYKYRGGAAMQTTGLAAYKRLSDIAGVDFVANPDLLCTPSYILFAAVVEWKEIGANAFADGDKWRNVSVDAEMQNPALRSITRRINGGLNGLADRAAQLVKTKAIYL